MQVENIYNRIVIVGNGFDRALGLPTSYGEFMSFYLYHKVKENVLSDRESFFTGEYSPVSIKIKRRITRTQWENEVIEWEADKTYSEVIKLFAKFLEINPNNEFYSDLIDLLHIQNWVDIEATYMNKVVKLFNSHKAYPNIDNLEYELSRMNECMDDLTLGLEKYLNHVQNTPFQSTGIYGLLRRAIGPLPDELSSEFKRHSRKKAPHKILFLNFNYTNFLANLLKLERVDNQIFKMIYIHGKVNDPINKLIFGYGDDTTEIYNELEETNSSEILRKVKSFRYQETSNYSKLIAFIDEAEYDVITMGHSCGLTDRTMLRTIFENKHCIGITRCHYRGRDEDFEKRMNISRHFRDKEMMRSRLFQFNQELSFNR